MDWLWLALAFVVGLIGGFMGAVLADSPDKERLTAAALVVAALIIGILSGHFLWR